MTKPRSWGAIRALALIGATLLATPAATARAQPPADSMPSVALPPDLDRVLRDYERAWRARDAAGLAALFTEDGFVLSGSRPPARGHAAIQERYTGAGGPLHLRAVAYAADDTVAYIIGMYGPTPEQGSNGKFTLTLRRRPGGPWLIASDMDNPNQPPRRGSTAAGAQVGNGLAGGVRLVYESGGARQAPWIYDSVRVVARRGFSRCVVVWRQGQAARESCVRGDTLFERAASGEYRAARPLGAGMQLDVRTASGAVMRFTTGSPAVRIGPGGIEIPYVPTMIVTRDSTGSITRRLREEFAPSLLTALAGVFEEPEGDGWRVTRVFTLAEIAGAPAPR